MSFHKSQQNLQSLLQFNGEEPIEIRTENLLAFLTLVIHRGHYLKKKKFPKVRSFFDNSIK